MYRKREVPEGTVPLALACAELKLSWPQGFRLILIGQLQGQRIRGRWYVAEESLRAMVEKAAAETSLRAMVEKATRSKDGMDGRKRRPRGRDGRYLAQAAKMPGG